MSASKHITIWCDFLMADGERCQRWTDHGMPTVAATLPLAKAEGWRRVQAGHAKRDLCPKHAREGGSPQ